MTLGDPIMDMQPIRDAIRSLPFEPFVLRMKDGRKLTIRHPESVALGQRTLVFVDLETGESTCTEPIQIEPCTRQKRTTARNCEASLPGEPSCRHSTLLQTRRPSTAPPCSSTRT